MERENILRQIGNIDTEIIKLADTLQRIEMTNFLTTPSEYDKLTVEASIQSEKIACKFRHLICATVNISKPELMKKISEVHEIEIDCGDGIFSVVLPSLLPKKRKSMSAEFLTDPLFYALERYFTVTDIERYRECVVCFTHIYSEYMPKRRVRDYDNLETKQVLDVIAAYIMTDDSGQFCDVYHSTEYGTKDCTVVSVMSKKRFKDWVAVRYNL
ncbi:MAG: DUF6100 family protein [Oscillospiraceae bacterium]|nr:DUF6100 family protein [Oscillospiraceae bacterium]